jgi:NAD+ synthase (glutamine-hydrolysing)
LYNSAVLIQNGTIRFEQHKTLLPNYDVFDEARYFDPSPQIEPFDFKNERLGITICEDAWNDPRLGPPKIYSDNPIQILADKGATLFINLSASPYHIEKDKFRIRLIQNHVETFHKPFILVNQIGGNDELIFDGNSTAIDSRKNLLARLSAFKEDTVTIDLNHPAKNQSIEFPEWMESVYQALLLGIRDYMRKCGFKQAVLGLSGGIDSALTCLLAADAIGPENVLAVAMPSSYSSKESVEDAEEQAKNLNVRFQIIPITPLYETYLKTFQEQFKGQPQDITEENIQARIRGNILMALSNKFGYLTLSTGNKSELSVGYCTLYGDMSGGLSVIADVPKTMVYELARYCNREKERIPKRIIEKPPSAELKPDQKDQDTLPPYETLDRILELYLDQGVPKQDILKENIDEKTVDWVIHALGRTEYKRRQTAPGLKVTTKAFGIGRRMPIAAKYK